MVQMDVWRARVEERKEVYAAAPNGCVFVEGARLGSRAIRGLLSPVADLPEGTNKYGQGSPDLELSGFSQKPKRHVVPHMQLSAFEVLQQVGVGGFGQVRLANFKGDKGSAPVAIKEVKEDSGSCITVEASLHANLSHPRIVPILAVLPSKEDNAVISGLVTSYCEGGSLGEWLDIRRSRMDAVRREDAEAAEALSRAPAQQDMLLPWGQRLRIAEHVLEALAYMHARNVCHLDLKPGNLLMRSCHPDTDADILLCDFGLACCADGSVMPGRYRGTWPYMPPEMVFSNQTCAHPSLDMWSVGVVFLDLVSVFPVGNLMSPEEIKSELRDRALYTDLEHEAGVYCEPEWLQLLEKCLQYDPAKRASAATLLEFVRAQRVLCEHREKMRCMLRAVATGTIASTSSGRSAADMHVSNATFEGACMRGELRLPESMLSNGETPDRRARQLNLPDSLVFPVAAPAPVKVTRGVGEDEEGRNRCVELNLPESLGLYTGRHSSGDHGAAMHAWYGATDSATDAETPGASANPSGVPQAVGWDSATATETASGSDVARTASDRQSVQGNEGELSGSQTCAYVCVADRQPLCQYRDHSYLPNSLGLYRERVLYEV